MQPIDVVILVSAVAAVAGVAALTVVRKKQGKRIGCDCSACEGCCKNCPSAQPSERTKEE